MPCLPAGSRGSTHTGATPVARFHAMLPSVTTAHSISELTVSARTRRRLEEASGGLATSSVTVMAERFPWFRRLSADQRAGILLVTQTGVTNFVAWLGQPTQTIRLTAEGFRNAPRDLA